MSHASGLFQSARDSLPNADITILINTGSGQRPVNRFFLFIMAIMAQALAPLQLSAQLLPNPPASQSENDFA
jgi:hypothetical protein